MGLINKKNLSERIKKIGLKTKKESLAKLESLLDLHLQEILLKIKRNVSLTGRKVIKPIDIEQE